MYAQDNVREVEESILKPKTMDINTKITTKTASGKVIRQSAERRIDWCNTTRMKLLESRTVYEDIIFSKLNRNKRKYAIRQQRLEFEGHIYFADIYIDRWKIIIEVDGGYHKTSTKHRSDKIRDGFCSKHCIRVFRITNEQFLDENILSEFMLAVNESELLSKNMRPLNERELKFLSNPDFATNGINKKSPRIYEYSNGGCKKNSIKFLRKRKLIEQSRQA